jgi:hypothetical protein
MHLTRMTKLCAITAVTVAKSTYRKLALFVRVGGEGKAHTYAKRCHQQLCGGLLV